MWGIEISEESVACAIENQELNAIGNTAFFAGNVGEVLRELRDRAGAPDVVVVDPPRAGLAGKALKRLGRARGAAHRLRLVQPDDARRRPEALGRRTTATGSCARSRSTCSRTRRTSSAWRCSNGDQTAGGGLTPLLRLGLPSLRQSRSAFGSRNPSEIAGQRRQPAQVEVDRQRDRVPEPGDERHPRRSRRAGRSGTAAPRKSAKKSRSGTPRFAAACSPGTGNANDSTLNTCSWCATICFVGPRQTEYASTQGMMQRPARPRRRSRSNPGTTSRAASSRRGGRSSPRPRNGRRSARRRAPRTTRRPGTGRVRSTAAARRARARTRRASARPRSTPRPTRGPACHQCSLRSRSRRQPAIGRRLLIGRQFGPPGADGLECVPKGRLRGGLVEREVDVGYGSASIVGVKRCSPPTLLPSV